jgi:thiol-disulfide isomerase/thioredoxin
MKMSVKHHESGEIMEVVATPYAATYMSVVSTEEGEEEEEEDEEGGVGAEATSGGLGCVAWRAVSGCAPEGAPRAPQDDKGCDEVVGSGSAGWCECEFEARARETGCVHEMFTCRAACATVDEGLARSHTESIEVATTTTTAEMVRAFQQAPEFVEYGSHNIMDHVRKDKPFALFMLCECASELKWPIAELRAHRDWPQLADKFVFGFIRLASSDQFQLWDNFAMERGGPSLGIDNIPAGQNLEKYLFRPATPRLMWLKESGQRPPVPVTGAELAAFFTGFVDETLPMVVKSEDVPLARRRLRGVKGQVTVAVGSTLQQIVLDEHADVLVLFYSPHCPGSQVVLPVFEALAQEFKDDDTRLLVKLNMLTNDIPIKHVKVTHFPALWLWSRGHKDKPIDYKQYNHQLDDGDGVHSHFELGMMTDFLRHKDHHVRDAHHEGRWDEHLMAK